MDASLHLAAQIFMKRRAREIRKEGREMRKEARNIKRNRWIIDEATGKN